eukprot:gene11011-18975_t
MSGASGSIPVGSTVPAPGSGPILTKAELKVCRGCILGENYGKKLKKLAQETHGDAGALSASRLSQWIARVVPILYTLMTVCLDKSNRDTHIILLTIERVEKKPYFKYTTDRMVRLVSSVPSVRMLTWALNPDHSAVPLILWHALSRLIRAIDQNADLGPEP